MPRIITLNDFEAARERGRRGPDAAIAETLRSWATDTENYTLAPDVARAAVLVEAGETFGYAGDHAEAYRLFDAARADGGETYVDPRALMVQALYEGGRKDAALELADALRKEGPRDVNSFLVIGGFLEVADELTAAQRWFSMGIRAMDSGNVRGSESQYESMLMGRARVRGALGLARDTLDDAAVIIVEGIAAAQRGE